MTDEGQIRFTTNIITFFNTGTWGMKPNLRHVEWVRAFERDPRWHFEQMFDRAADAGMEGVELAPDPCGWEAALHAFGSPKAIKKALLTRGLVLSSSYSPGRQLIGNALTDIGAEAVADDHMLRHAQFLVDMDADTVVTGNVQRSRFGNGSPDETAVAEDFSADVDPGTHRWFASQLNRLGDIVGRYDVRLAVHTDCYSVCSRPRDIATVMSLTDPRTVQLCPDAGHIALDGGDPVEVLRDNIDRIPTMHWKDCIGPLSGHTLRGEQHDRHAVMLTYFRVLGSGTVRWDDWMTVLRDNRWSGWATEEIDHSLHPVEELRDGLDFYRNHLAPIYRGGA